MNMLNFLSPNKLIAKYSSDFSGVVEVRSEFGRLRVWAGGIPQSGGIVQDILKKALNEFDNPERFLLLGIGGGAILHEVRRRWPDCEITAVEIDSVMIKIAEKYFGVGEIGRLKVVNADAVKFCTRGTLASLQGFPLYDAILVDCYLGDRVPKELESEMFLQNLKKLLVTGGKIAFNRIISPKESYLATQRFIEKLEMIFDRVKTKKAYSNLIVAVG